VSLTFLKILLQKAVNIFWIIRWAVNI